MALTIRMISCFGGFADAVCSGSGAYLAFLGEFFYLLLPSSFLDLLLCLLLLVLDNQAFRVGFRRACNVVTFLLRFC